MPFENLAFLLPRQRVEYPPQLTARLLLLQLGEGLGHGTRNRQIAHIHVAPAVVTSGLSSAVFDPKNIDTPAEGTKRILAVLEDLFFMVKINESAKRAGLAVDFVKTEQDVFVKANSRPALIIVDLNCHVIDPLSLIVKLKSSAELKTIGVIGFVSHVQGELKQKAHQAGCDMVLARSAFSQNLPKILKRHAGAL